LTFTCLRGNTGPGRKEAVCSISHPNTHWQIREFWGAAGFCQVWILNYSLLAKPFYEATKQGEWETLVWGREQEKPFKEIKKALTNAPALGLPDVRKPFSCVSMNKREQLFGS
jgi:hypothetical protein